MSDSMVTVTIESLQMINQGSQLIFVTLRFQAFPQVFQLKVDDCD